jgi:Protein of unknown function (DUF1638).
MMKIISCEVFKPYIEMLSIEKEVVYIEIEGHDRPMSLSKMIQREIDKSQGYEKILLLYGLCGNATLSIKANDIPMYIVRVHDCLSILLGSKDRFYKLFHDRLSESWSCYSLEKRDYHFDDYDEEEREYLKQILMPQRNVYITFLKDDEKVYEEKYKEVIQGDLSFLKDIIDLKSKELLELNKDERLKYSEKEVIEKERNNG